MISAATAIRVSSRRANRSPIIDQAGVGVVQGYLEGSNVDPVLEITRLIQGAACFEGVSSLLRDSESTLREAIKTLGS